MMRIGQVASRLLLRAVAARRPSFVIVYLIVITGMISAGVYLIDPSEPQKYEIQAIDESIRSPNFWNMIPFLFQDDVSPSRMILGL